MRIPYRLQIHYLITLCRLLKTFESHYWSYRPRQRYNYPCYGSIVLITLGNSLMLYSRNTCSKLSILFRHVYQPRESNNN